MRQCEARHDGCLANRGLLLFAWQRSHDDRPPTYREVEVMNKFLSLLIVVVLGGMLIALAQSAPQQPASGQPSSGAAQPPNPSGNPSQAQPASPSGSGNSAGQAQPTQPTQPATQPTQGASPQSSPRRGGVPWVWVAIGVAVLVIVLVALAGRGGSSTTTIVDRTERIDRDRDDIRRAG